MRPIKERPRRACAISRLSVCARCGDGLGSDGGPVGRAVGDHPGDRPGDAEYRSAARRASVAGDGSSGSGVPSERRRAAARRCCEESSEEEGGAEGGEEGGAEVARGGRSGER